MQTSLHKSLIFLTIFFTSFGFMFAQPAHKAKERIQLLKKMKILEILDLDEANSEKFLVKYNFYENKLDDLVKSIDDAADELESLLKKAASKEDIQKSSQKLLKLQTDLNNLINEKNASIKTILNEVDYAKYLVFEHRFRQ